MPEDVLTLMTVDVGYAGQPFIEEMLEKIAQAARLREENPDSSLSELTEMSALSRSGVNHRLRRIVDIAAALDENV